MKLAAAHARGLLPATERELRCLEQVRVFLKSCGEIPMPTEHVLHGGMYVRTIHMKPGDVVLGSLIKLATIVILNGCASVLTGEQESKYQGYNVIPGSAGRQSLFIAHNDVDLTMIFPTLAQTVEQAEEQVFAQYDLLVSRRDGNENTVIITGE